MLLRIAPGIVLLCEGLLLSVLFDVRRLLDAGGWWASFGHLGIWAPYAFVIAVAGLSALAVPVWEAAQGQSKARVWRWLLGGVPFYGATLALSAALMGDQAAGQWLAVAWLVSLGLWLLVRAHAFLPLDTCARIAREHRLRCAFGCAVGTSAAAAAWAAQSGWAWLAPLTLAGSHWILALLGRDPWFEAPDILGAGDFSVQIAPACSGVEGMGLTAVFVLGFILIGRERLRLARALALLPLVLVTAYLLNLLRIAALVSIGAGGAPEIAVGGFHSKAGWVLFTLLAVLSVRLLQTARFQKEAGEAVPLPRVEAGRATPYLVPLIALTFAGLVTEAFSSGIDHNYFVRVVVGGLAVAWALPQLSSFEPLGRFEPLGPQGWLVSIAAGALGFVIWTSLAGEDQVSGELLRASLAHAPRWRRVAEPLVRAVGGCLVVPVVEELAFRGYLLRRLHVWRAAAGRFEALPYASVSLVAVVVSSVVFGVLHGTAWLAATLCGVLYAWAARRTDRLASAVIAHAVTNFGIAVAENAESFSALH